MLSFKIAFRFLTSTKGQTILIILGVAVGVSVQIFIGSLIQGLQSNLINITVGNSSHITITSESDRKTIANWRNVVRSVKKGSSAIKNLAVAADGAGFADAKTESVAILLRGFQPEAADKIYGISDRLVRGKLPLRSKQTVIGTELAKKLGADIGSDIKVTIPRGDTVTLKVTGIFDLQVAALNRTWVVTDLETAQSVLKIGDEITSIEMQTREVFTADTVARKVKRALLDPKRELKVDNWKAMNSQLLSGLRGQSISSYMIQVFVLIAVLLGISSVLAISVVQRSKQIGILKAMGIKDFAASMIFVYQGLMLGFLGAVVGIGMGYGLLVVFAKFAVNENGTPIVPVAVDMNFILISGVFAIGSAMIASIIPARLSSRLNPIEVIKNG